VVLIGVLGPWVMQSCTPLPLPTDSERIQKVGQLRLGVAKVVEDPHYTPAMDGKYVVADLITGWGVAEAVRHYYRIYDGSLAGKRVIVQGWGNVGSAAAYYLAQEGARVVGIIDRAGGLIDEQGLGFERIRELFLNKNGNQLVAEQLLPNGRILCRRPHRHGNRCAGGLHPARWAMIENELKGWSIHLHGIRT
jgi:hypothetical protein